MTAFIKNGTETVCPAHRLSRKKPPSVPCHPVPHRLSPQFLSRYRLSRTVYPVLTVYPAGIDGFLTTEDALIPTAYPVYRLSRLPLILFTAYPARPFIPYHLTRV